MTLSRAELLRRAAAFAAGAGVLEQLPNALRAQGWLAEAEAATADVVDETLSALVAFVLPGRDAYSRAQGTRGRTRGGVAVGTTPLLIRTLDRFLPSPLPLSATAATILNEFALVVRPSSRRGPYSSPFANLSFGQKARVFQRAEELQADGAGAIRFLIGNLPGLVAFLALSRPRAHGLTRYAGVADGRAELKGYWQGRRSADA